MSDYVKAATDYVNIISFMFWLERDSPNAMWGGVKISDAINSFCAILGLSREQCERIAFVGATSNER